ncbi:S1 family peptidase [Spirosoma fluviale]|uniref:Trypsin-like peptidase domain-containing protein n=1 Tax=Spirosoma fluviale TaxID=1597977 RepID=A0A286GW22_9BACT|nr:serine protease [Spirosoma fluviale]SOD99757.1 hypothetical protein SAMN06269250_0148 [Spirosoma fluviale]
MKELQKEAIVKVSIKNSWQTGWFFSSNGLIMTAGHGFSDIENPNLLHYNIFTNSGRESLEAELIESQYVEEKAIDYAILKVVESSYKRFKSLRIPYIPLKDFSIKYINKLFVTKGFSEDISEDIGFTFSGKVIDKVKLKSNDDYWIQLRIDSIHDWGGVSGAPIIVNNYAIGLQSGQVDKAKVHCLAAAFNNIKNRYVRESIYGGIGLNIQDAVKRFNLILVPQPEYIDRYTIFITDRSTVQNEIYLSIANDDAFDEINTVIMHLMQRFSGSEYNGLIKRSKVKFSRIQRKSSVDLLNYLETWGKENDPAWKNLVRVIIDIDGNIISNHNKPDKLNEYLDTSFIVGVDIKKTKNKNSLNTKVGPSFDKQYELDYEDEKESDSSRSFFKKAVHNIIADVFLDTLYFYSHPIIRSLYSTISAKQSFSQAKAIFARDSQLLSYGNSIKDDDTFITFSSCARDSVTDKLNGDKFIEIWSRFVDGGIFNNTPTNNNPNGPNSKNTNEPEKNKRKMREEEIIEILLKAPKLGGQLSRRKILGALKKFDSSLEEPFAFVVVTKRPKDSKALRGITSHFDRKPENFKLKMCKFFTINDLKPLLVYSHLIRVFLFGKH